MIIPLVLTVLAIFILLVSNELWFRGRKVHDEFSRKFVHITVGSFVAFWPFFLSWNEIRLLSLAFFLVVCLSKYLHIFRAIHSVQRPTWGELFFAIAVGGVTLITNNKWIYLAALLQMSLADGLAAVVGVQFGLKRTAYRVFGHTKTLVGSTTFALISIAILIGFSYFSHMSLTPLSIAGLALAATLIENCGVRGLDNLLVPVVVALGLRLLV
jgi:phytol kinase